MKQNVETLIIGGGRMATQFKHYLDRIGVSYNSWLRSEGAFTLKSRTVGIKRALILIPDKAITPFVDQYQDFLKSQILIHFSATHSDPRVLGFHPLGSFIKSEDPGCDFSDLHFHGVHPESLFHEALPFLKNKYKELSSKEMQTYHALCVVGGNFSAILWNAFFKEMSQLGIDTETAKSYFCMICSNILSDHSRAVTGPLVRNDTPTIEKNIRALEDKKELQEIYKTFAKVFTQDFKDSEYLQ